MSEATRAYIYRIAIVLALVAVAYGIISEEQSELWLQVIVAVLAIAPTGLAVKNTSTSSEG